MYWSFTEGLAPEMFTSPEFKAVYQAIATAGREQQRWVKVNAKFNKEMEGLGYPPATRPHAMAPFDLITDNLRGMRGSMLDMYRKPDKVVAACEKILPWVIERTLASAKATGVPRVFIPLHRGAEGFMSIKQFEKFYWPTFKALLLALIDAGLTPCPFFEGDYTSRLEYLLELPKGKVMAHLDTTDIFKAKEIIGKNVCIRGNFPVSLLQTGTVEEVKAHTKKLIDVVGKDGGYIMGARGSLDEANPELVKVWIDYTKEYGVYR
jgi:uroporphyrinogen-III decarboxylase